MKRIVCIAFLLISINVLGQDSTRRHNFCLGIEGYGGYNNINDFFKAVGGKTINTNNIYLQSGFGLKLYDFLYSDISPKNKHPLVISTGITFFNIGKGNVVSIPLNLRADARLSNRIMLSANIGGRYSTNARDEFNNKIVLEYGFEIKLIYIPAFPIIFGWSIIQKANFIHAELPIIPLN